MCVRARAAIFVHLGQYKFKKKKEKNLKKKKFEKKNLKKFAGAGARAGAKIAVQVRAPHTIKMCAMCGIVKDEK